MLKKITCILMACLLLVSVFAINSNSAAIAFAATTRATTAEEDLSKAENFNSENFEQDSDSLALNLIQIGLTENYELYVYVHVPGDVKDSPYDIHASSINISLSDNPEAVDYENYKLEAIDTEGIFHKYKVLDISIKAAFPLYINISSIFRLSIDGLDNLTPDQFITEIANKVGKIFTVRLSSTDLFHYVCEDFEVVKVTSYYNGYIRYWDGEKFLDWFDYTDSFFVSFSTDWQIDDLYEAEVSFYTQYHEKRTGGLITKDDYEKPIFHNFVIKPDKVSYDPSGWFAKNREWSRIQRVKDFIATEDLTDEAKAKVSKHQWVLRYFEAPFTHFEYTFLFVQNINVTETLITDFTILSLKFRKGIDTYNLGVVADKVNPDREQSNEKDLGILGDIDDWWDKLLGLIFVVVIGFIFWPVLKPVLSYIVKGLVWIITLPFKLVDKLVKKLKKSKRKK